MSKYKPLMLALTASSVLVANNAVASETSSAEAALEDFRGKKQRPHALENRFFAKKNRFELAPAVGYVPNNPFASRYVASLGFGYHFSEELAVSGQFSYSPDLAEDDLKGLTTVLVDRAYNAAGSDQDFQQPLDKVTISAVFGVTWAPLYGKINLLGETVVNFDFYAFAGLGMFSKANYNAVYDVENAIPEEGDIISLEDCGFEVKFGPSIASGTILFITQSVALMLDGRLNLFVDNQPQYQAGEPPEGQRLVNRFVASIGVSVFVPRMKPRLYNF